LTQQVSTLKGQVSKASQKSKSAIDKNKEELSGLKSEDKKGSGEVEELTERLVREQKLHQECKDELDAAQANLSAAKSKIAEQSLAGTDVCVGCCRSAKVLAQQTLQLQATRTLFTTMQSASMDKENRVAAAMLEVVCPSESSSKLLLECKASVAKRRTKLPGQVLGLDYWPADVGPPL